MFLDDQEPTSSKEEHSLDTVSTVKIWVILV